ncbi:MAG: phage holin family protein [Candidatus Caldarchaeum sp.]
MLRILLYWVLSVAALVLSALLAKALGFQIEVFPEKPLLLFVGVALLGIVNVTLGTLARFFTAPLNCATFGLAWIVVNALIFWGVGSLKIGFYVRDFWSALIGSLLMSLALGFIKGMLKKQQ